MKFLTGHRLLLAATALVAVVAVGPVVQFQYWRSHPDSAFAQITGRTLPAGVHASAYRWSLNDNFLHIGHYWLLTGSGTALRQVIAGTSFAESTEDARWVLPEAATLFELSNSPSQVLVGYEDDSFRNSWYLIFNGETEALYVHN